jgi:hypothetical protein
MSTSSDRVADESIEKSESAARAEDEEDEDAAAVADADADDSASPPAGSIVSISS